MTATTAALWHPLAPLTEAEINQARDAILKLYGSEDAIFFRSIHLKEPKREELVPFLELEHTGKITPESARPRRLASVEYDAIKTKVPEFIRAWVDVATGEVVQNDSIPRHGTSQPYVALAEFIELIDICQASEVFKEALTEFTLPEGFDYTIDPWPYGPPGDDEEPPRYIQGLVFARDTTKKNGDANHYAYPIPLVPVVDWTTKRVIRVDRLPTGGKGDGFEPAAKQDKPRKLFENSVHAEYAPELLDIPERFGLKPLNVVQPEGASFKVHPDGLLEWQKWRFRVSFTAREGAVLHDVCYDNRSILYRLSFSELTVPYADPRPPFHRKQAFDFGDCGVGRMANSLQLGCDCLGAIHYLDTLLIDSDGKPTKLASAVCLHEQDNGILWKHTNFRTDRAVVTRNREFVVQFIATLANYEYILAYKFDLAGGLTVETRATGIVSAVNIDYGKTSDYGNVVAPGVLAQNHQHIFAVRIDPAIDSYQTGGTQVVVEESVPQKKNPQTNPHGNMYLVERKPVAKAAWFDAEPRLNRTIKLESSDKKNPISGKNVGFKLVAPATSMLLADPESAHAARAPFAQHNIWVTGYRDGELWAAGEFTNQSKAEEGGVGDMVKRGDWFIDDNQNIHSSNGDASAQKSSPVVWSVFGLTHNPRVEDWPVMPVEIHQMHLRPSDFFTSNPALDVPSNKNSASVLVPCCDGQNQTNGTNERSD